MNNGYDFYFKDGSNVLTFPITPGELTISSGSKNTTVTLINEGEINILRSPSLIEISFEARFPMRDYPFSRSASEFQSYFDTFKDLKESKKSFRFIVSRNNLSGYSSTWDTNLLMALEEFETKESADEGDDVICNFKLKQFKQYGVTVIPTKNNKANTTSTSSAQRNTDNKSSNSQSYKVKSGDTLWGISKRFYGSGSTWKKIYNANKTAIENDAKKHGRQSSSQGHWIYPGLSLTIPTK